MPSSKVTSKGQITIPVEVRRALALKPGDRVLFVEGDDGWRLAPGNLPVTALRGRFKGRRKAPLTVEEMDSAIRETAVARYRRAVEGDE